MHKQWLYILIISLTLISGCVVTNSKTGEVMHIGGIPTKRENSYPYQPLVKPPYKSLSILTLKDQNAFWPETFTTSMKWKSGIWRSWDADKTVDQCLDFIKNSEQQYTLDKIQMPLKEISTDIRYPWQWKSRIIRKAGGYYDRNGVLSKPKKDELSVYTTIRTIVCLQPIIIIQTSGIILSSPHSSPINNMASPCRKDIKKLFGTNLKMYILKEGFAYGTRIPYDSTPYWFSPDMKTLLQPVSIDDNGIGHISVPWGKVLLTKKEDEWIASAKANTP